MASTRRFDYSPHGSGARTRPLPAAPDASPAALPAGAEGQEALVRAVRKANPHTVVVLETSYPVSINWEQANIPAIVWTTHAGAETGHAVADVLFGDVNPGGRLTQTWYRSDADLPSDLLNYDIINSGQTYQYFRGKPLYPFGYGLSYTTFRYSGLRVDPRGTDGHGTVEAAGRNHDDATIQVSLKVTNTGRRAGDEVVQLYTHQQTSRDVVPLRKLQASERVHLAAGQTRTVRFSLPVSKLAHWDVTRSRWVVESSAYDLMVGSSSQDIRQRTTLRVHGETIPPRNLSAVTRAENFDTYAGIRLVDETKAAGTSIASGATGTSWAEYADAALGGGTRAFTAQVANESAGIGSVQVRLDSPTGRLLGTASVPSTGSVYSYETVTASLAAARGRHPVYLVLSPGLRLSTFSVR